MSDKWLTTEPEVGTVATLYDLDGRQLLGEFTDQGWWLGENDFLTHDCVEKWKPITTPEEARLRKELEDLRHAVDCDLEHIEAYHQVQKENDGLRERVLELEDGIKLHKDLMEQDEHEIYAADERLWELIEKQEGGGGWVTP